MTMAQLDIAMPTGTGAPWFEASPDSLQFFNARALSLRQGGDLFDIAVRYPARKRVPLSSDDPARYVLDKAGTFYRRLAKRLHWARKRFDRGFGQLPPSESAGSSGPLNAGVANG
jgi:hypothetical protein